MAMGLRNWLVKHFPLAFWARPRPALGPSLDGNEYALLMDSIAARSASAASDAPVRSSGWLLHFAVSSLSRAGLTLQQAASRLERLETDLQGPTAGAAE
jgi:hypothetical protein